MIRPVRRARLCASVRDPMRCRDCLLGGQIHLLGDPSVSDPEVKPLFTTPNHPSYLAAHAYVSIATARMMGYLFPATPTHSRRSESPPPSRASGTASIIAAISMPAASSPSRSQTRSSSGPGATEPIRRNEAELRLVVGPGPLRIWGLIEPTMVVESEIPMSLGSQI